jgi:hypothetical protein
LVVVMVVTQPDCSVVVSVGGWFSASHNNGRWSVTRLFVGHGGPELTDHDHDPVRGTRGGCSLLREGFVVVMLQGKGEFPTASRPKRITREEDAVALQTAQGVFLIGVMTRLRVGPRDAP